MDNDALKGSGSRVAPCGKLPPKTRLYLLSQTIDAAIEHRSSLGLRYAQGAREAALCAAVWVNSRNALIDTIQRALRPYEGGPCGLYPWQEILLAGNQDLSR